MGKTSELHKRPLVFGLIAGNPIVINVPTGASEVFTNSGGKWVSNDADAGRVVVCGATTTNINGWAMCGAITTSSTDEVTKINVDISLDTIYEMPIDAAQSAADLLDVLWESCDIVVTSNVQYADLDASTYDILQIVDFRAYEADSANNTVITRRNITGTTASVICAKGLA